MGILKVNEEQCIGCGACVAIDSEHFDFNENGLSNAIKQDNLESANLKSAMESCPTGAISIGEATDEVVASEPKTECACEDKKCGCCEECTGEAPCECGCEDCKCNE